MKVYMIWIVNLKFSLSGRRWIVFLCAVKSGRCSSYQGNRLDVRGMDWSLGK